MTSPFDVIQIPQTEEAAAKVAQHLVKGCGLIGTQIAEGLQSGITPHHPPGAPYCSWETEGLKVILPHSVAKFPINPIPPENLCRLAVHLIFAENDPMWASTYVLHKMSQTKSRFWQGVFDIVSFLITMPRSLCDVSEVWHPDLRQFVANASFKFRMLCGSNRAVDRIVDGIMSLRPWVVETGAMFDLATDTLRQLNIRFLVGTNTRRRVVPDIELLGIPVFISDSDCVLMFLSWLFSERTMWIDGCPDMAPESFKQLFEAHPELMARGRSVLFLAPPDD